jgi:hypothetical protein
MYLPIMFRVECGLDTIQLSIDQLPLMMCRTGVWVRAFAQVGADADSLEDSLAGLPLAWKLGDSSS